MNDINFGISAGAARFDTTHGQGGLFHNALRYPSPFFDIGHTYLPTSVKQLFQWCRYYFLTNPLINAVTYKLAEYPITEYVVDDEDEEFRKHWESIMTRQLRLRSFQVEVGLDFYCYGNAFVSVHFPFQKYLVCANCNNKERVQKANYRFRDMKFHLTCERCGVFAEVKRVEDFNIKSIKGVRLIRWNPEYINVETNEATGETSYFYNMPLTLRNDILMGKKHIIETIPDEFLRALRTSQSLHIAPDQIYHLKRPTIAQQDQGWGMPLILPVLKDSYYLQILRKAQEAIAQQNIVPLRILFPQAGSADSSPYQYANLSDWKRRIESEIQKWRSDANYIPILPLPIGNETIGGEGKALMLHQEMRAWSEQIVAGMQVPIEFIFGGLQYSGTNVSLRMLQQSFIGYRNDQHILCQDFILGRIADFMGWLRPKCKFKRFRMADDIQRSQLLFNVSQAMKISDTTLLDDLDLDLEQEEKYKRAEMATQVANQERMQTEQTHLQGKLGILQAKYQALAQRVMMAAGGPPGGAQPPQAGADAGAGGGVPGLPQGGAGDGSQQPMEGVTAGTTLYPENASQVPTEGIPQEIMSQINMNSRMGPGGNMNLLYVARREATNLEKMDPATKAMEMMKLRNTSPQLYSLVSGIMFSGQGSQENPLDALQSPMSEIKPSRRPAPVA